MVLGGCGHRGRTNGKSTTAAVGQFLSFNQIAGELVDHGLQA
jgi:hypothetical protein